VIEGKGWRRREFSDGGWGVDVCVGGDFVEDLGEERGCGEDVEKVPVDKCISVYYQGPEHLQVISLMMKMNGGVRKEILTVISALSSILNPCSVAQSIYQYAAGK